MSDPLQACATHPLRFFVGIDNYTAPLLQGTQDHLEGIIVEEIFIPIFNPVPGGTIARVWLATTCQTVASGHTNAPNFFNWSLELSDDRWACPILGLSVSEIEALGNVLLGEGNSLLLQTQMRAQGPGLEHDDIRLADGRYCTRDVLALARALQAATHSSPSFPSCIIAVTEDDYTVYGPTDLPAEDGLILPPQSERPPDFWTRVFDANPNTPEKLQRAVDAAMRPRVPSTPPKRQQKSEGSVG